jgi:hypothetical protein
MLIDEQHAMKVLIDIFVVKVSAVSEVVFGAEYIRT